MLRLCEEFKLLLESFRDFKKDSNLLVLFVYWLLAMGYLIATPYLVKLFGGSYPPGFGTGVVDLFLKSFKFFKVLYFHVIMQVVLFFVGWWVLYKAYCMNGKSRFWFLGWLWVVLLLIAYVIPLYFQMAPNHERSWALKENLPLYYSVGPFKIIPLLMYHRTLRLLFLIYSFICLFYFVIFHKELRNLKDYINPSLWGTLAVIITIFGIFSAGANEKGWLFLPKEYPRHIWLLQFLLLYLMSIYSVNFLMGKREKTI